MAVKEQLLLLHKLQEIDARTQEARNAIATLPEKLRPAKEDLARLEALLAGERERLAETERWRAEQEELIRREEEALRAAKAKLQQSKTAKDYAAASREIDNKRRSMNEREQEVLKVLEAIEQTKKSLDERGADVARLRESVEAEEAQLRGQLEALQAEADRESAGRDEIAAQVDPKILARYEMVQKRRGVAVAAVEGGVCQGCFMSVPPQLVNIIARAESIESCPRCQRLLFRPELVEDGD